MDRERANSIAAMDCEKKKEGGIPSGRGGLLRSPVSKRGREESREGDTEDEVTKGWMKSMERMLKEILENQRIQAGEMKEVKTKMEELKDQVMKDVDRRMLQLKMDQDEAQKKRRGMGEQVESTDFRVA